jgi:3-methyl-2-oxobutanoate hydroxymethyltransferase
VLVCNDLLGFSNGFSPKFAKKYRNLHDEIVGAVSEYISDVRDRSFPGPEHSFKIDEEVLEKLY